MNSNKLQNARLFLLLFVGIFLPLNFLSAQVDSKPPNFDRLAGEKCLWYSSWNSAANPDPSLSLAKRRSSCLRNSKRMSPGTAQTTSRWLCRCQQLFVHLQATHQKVTRPTVELEGNKACWALLGETKHAERTCLKSGTELR